MTEEKHNPLSYFEALSRIPHGSGNTAAATRFCLDFAKENGLFAVSDALGNVVIRKPASRGAEDETPVILQGHLDMVTVKEPDRSIDMEKEGITLICEGDILRADGTSLGADNGIAVAMVMALLADPDAHHPPLEAVFTVDEEIGLLGALGMDMSALRGRRYINLDSDAEGVLTVSSAGGARVDIRLPVCFENQKGTLFSVSVSGLRGGHSGVTIGEGRPNALRLAAEMLTRVSAVTPIRLASFAGGDKDNAIPAGVVFSFFADDVAAAEEALCVADNTIRVREGEKDPDILVVRFQEEDTRPSLSYAATRVFRNLLFALPNGALAMSSEIAGLVETSANLAVARLDGKEAEITVSIRSALADEKEKLLADIQKTAEMAGATVTVRGDYPAWEYRKASPLRDTACAVYRRLFGRDMKVEAIHAGLECGVFYHAIPDLDAISLGPDMWDIHTSAERLSLSSVERTYTLLTEILEDLAKGENQ